MSKAIREAEKRARERELQKQKKPYEELRMAAKVKPTSNLEVKDRDLERRIFETVQEENDFLQYVKTFRPKKENFDKLLDALNRDDKETANRIISEIYESMEQLEKDVMRHSKLVLEIWGR